MSNILFDEEQQKQLRANHWVKSVTEKSISFTEDFKVEFVNGVWKIKYFYLPN